MDPVHEVLSCIFGPKRHCLYQPWQAHSERSYRRSSSCTDEPSWKRIRFLSIGTTKLHWDRGQTQYSTMHTSKHRSVLPHLQQSVRDLRASLERRTADRRHSSGRRIVNDISTRTMGKRSWNGRKELVLHVSHLKTAAGPLTQCDGLPMRQRYAFFFSHGSWKLKYSEIGRWTPTITTDAGFQVYQTHWVDYPQNDGFLDNMRTSASEGRDQGCGVHARVRNSFTGYFQRRGLAAHC